MRASSRDLARDILLQEGVIRRVGAKAPLPTAPSTPLGALEPLADIVGRSERRAVEAVVREHDGNLSATSRQLGVDHTSFGFVRCSCGNTFGDVGRVTSFVSDEFVSVSDYNGTL